MTVRVQGKPIEMQLNPYGFLKPADSLMPIYHVSDPTISVDHEHVRRKEKKSRKSKQSQKDSTTLDDPIVEWALKDEGGAPRGAPQSSGPVAGLDEPGSQEPSSVPSGSGKPVAPFSTVATLPGSTVGSRAGGRKSGSPRSRRSSTVRTRRDEAAQENRSDFCRARRYDS